MKEVIFHNAEELAMFIAALVRENTNCQFRAEPTSEVNGVMGYVLYIRKI